MYEIILEFGNTVIADIINKNDVETIRNKFHIQNDFTPEELEQIKKENKFEK